MLFDFTPQLMLIEGAVAPAAPSAKEARAPYAREVYKLVDCPPVAFGVRFVLVGADAAGKPVALGIGRALSESDTLNLAEVRHRAACLGACEVHLLTGM